VGAAVTGTSVASADASSEPDGAADAELVALAVGAPLPDGDVPADGVVPPPVQAQARSAAARAKPENLTDLVMGVSPLSSCGAGPLPGAQQATMTLSWPEA